MTQKVREQPEPSHQKTAGVPGSSGRLPFRLALAGVVFGIEICIVAALGHPWAATGQISTAPVLFVAALLFFGRERLRTARLGISAASSSRVPAFLALHVAACVVMLAAYRRLSLDFAHHVSNSIAFAVWCFALLAMGFTLLAMAVAPRALVSLSKHLGIVWAYAVACALLGLSFRTLEYLAWNAPNSWLGNHLAVSAFHGVHWLLSLFYPVVYSDPGGRILGTSKFLIHVASTCSGIEGLGLTLVLTLGWILYERRHLRIARALLLVPLSLALIWCLNIVRMTALIAIGDAGHPKLALTGFHTEAGWIAFTLVAICFLLVASHITWFQRSTVISAAPGTTDETTATAQSLPVALPIRHDNTVVAYVLPFVAILAVSLFTRIFDTNGFEVLYPVRLFVVAAILFAFRKQYASFSWRVRPLDLAAGAAVGILWIYLAPHGNSAHTANGLASLRLPSRIFWLSARILAAIVTVPIAEELAFRGFLARRIVAERFELVRYASLTFIAIAVSSIAFGAMHGSLWILGTISGIVFALVARHRNSLGAAIAAHAMANLVLAIAALAFGHYYLW